VAKVDPEGNVTAMDERLNPSDLSHELRDLLRGMAGKPAWRLGLDPMTSRLLLSAETGGDDRAAWLLDVENGGWDEWTPTDEGLPLVLAANGDGEGGYLAGAAAGLVYRVLDVAGEAAALFRWRSGDLGARGTHMRTERLTASFTGAPVFTVLLDGAVADTVTPRSGVPIYLKKALGEAAAVEVQATAPGDVVRTLELECSEWRG
jgi:hypothetical protein